MARYARAHGLEVFYQPIEQNYNTPEDPTWFEHSDNWPKDRERAVAAVQELIELKRQGLPIANSEHQLEVMIPYFRDPERLLILTQSHSAHDKPLCSALTTMQIQSNGDVRSCWCMDPIGNITADAHPPDLGEPSPLVGIGMLHGTADVGGREGLRGPDRCFLKLIRSDRMPVRHGQLPCQSMPEPEMMPTGLTLEPLASEIRRSEPRPAGSSGAVRPEARSRRQVWLDRGTDPDPRPVVPGPGQPVPAGASRAARPRIGGCLRRGGLRSRRST